MLPRCERSTQRRRQQFKTLYRSKYLPLKEEAQECRQDIARLKACRAADAEACEKWRAQVRIYDSFSLGIRSGIFACQLLMCLHAESGMRRGACTRLGFPSILVCRLPKD